MSYSSECFLVALLFTLSPCQSRPGLAFNTSSKDLQLYLDNELEYLLPVRYGMRRIDIDTWNMMYENKFNSPARHGTISVKPSSKPSSDTKKQSHHQSDIDKEDLVTPAHNSTLKKITSLIDVDSKRSNTCTFPNGLQTFVAKLNPHIDVSDKFIYRDIASLPPNIPEECVNRKPLPRHLMEQCYSIITYTDLGSSYFPRYLRNMVCMPGAPSYCHKRTQNVRVYYMISCENRSPNLIKVSRRVHTGCKCNKKN
ncbi:uncharacterized protein LOC129922148 [Biomphalaria glabrata]|uniref:Uncharacterized protein LOC129922148 n=1 Tax=Biomphalaria glabrata TaxID=6526 RepID=A0A9W2YJB8_BIOGL|nr:uncharacterized protein LOC129922148 [Biomphalaria glabrata]XP_055862868.1 uncharacterized protein LOC129922148 [Biomphalaria glabrata]XP_055862869.1 uncharacterized protein LOC129922148 [Biomphalaria glabrata]